MHERSEKIGAQLKIWNRPGAGCELELRVPAEIAHPKSVSAPFGRFIRNVFSRTKANNAGSLGSVKWDVAPLALGVLNGKR
jgi:hypothetical protein